MPLSLVDSQYFQNFSFSLDPQYQVPSRKFLTTKLVENKYEEIVFLLKDKLKLSDQVSVTVDVWTNRQMLSFLGMTGHIILNTTWTPISVLLACTRLSGRHTAVNLLKHYQDVIDKFEIQLKVKYIVTDSAANMIKAFGLPGFATTNRTEPNCQLQAELCEPLDTVMDCENDLDLELETCLSEDDSDGDNEDENLTNLDVRDILKESLQREIKHHRCFAHVLQLVIKDGFKESNNTVRILNGIAPTIFFFF